MFRIFFLCLISIGTSACDICGCYMGITPHDDNSSIGLWYRYRMFNGYTTLNSSPNLFAFKNRIQESLLTNNGKKNISNTNTNLPKHSSQSIQSKKDYEIYQSIELRAKYFLNSKLEFNLILPISINTQSLNGNRESIQGIGDANIIMAYHVINKMKCEGLKQRLITGLGIKIPIGNYNEKYSNGDEVDPLLETGTGSWDGIINLNYTAQVKSIGMNLNTMYKINSNNKFNEQFANGFTFFSSVFYKINTKNLSINPNFQSYFENSNGLYINDELIEGTQMKNMLAGLGADIYLKNISMSISCQLPVWETKTNELLNAGRIVCGINYYLKK
jgi:hypothetical protein